MRHGQDFVLPFDVASSTSFDFEIKSRTVKNVGRLVFANDAEGTLDALIIAGENLVLGSGFPLQALVKKALVDKDAELGVIVGPETPIQVKATLATAAKLEGYFGTNPVPPEIEAEALPLLQKGVLVGSVNFGWGLGKKTVATTATGAWSVTIPRAARLTRFGVVSDLASQAVGDLMITKFQIAGTDLFSRGANLDAGLCDPLASDEDGLRINDDIGTSDIVEIDIKNNNIGSADIYPFFFID